ncbi:hypothetical protein H6G89_06215 [Oscillatoria sp. FACHB-1407]|uniref:hypothetical protein n=1 Tax=Oscillatoria sp. FACHB-1407 TaxID=2692847 RepID=UPI0016893C6C|nr:hypothetical protein [Oscillatoria sp. FACHB-1407]MBD2460635.1 hypothetical protein [Oscillatoria sp. FACHB-1407]
MDTPQVPQPQKSLNVFKWIGIGCGGLFLLFILGSIGLAFFVQRFLNMSADPQQAEQTAQSIMGYDIPGGSEGFMSMEFSGMTFVGVGSASNPGEVTLMLGKVPSNANEFQDSFQSSFRESFENQSGQNISILASRTETKQLCGQAVTVTVVEGEQSTMTSTIPTLTYQTAIQHNQNLLFVTLTTSGDEAQAIAEQVFGSLSCK